MQLEAGFYEIPRWNRNARRNIRLHAPLWSETPAQLTNPARGGHHGSWNSAVAVGCADPGHHPARPHLALSRGVIVWTDWPMSRWRRMRPPAIKPLNHPNPPCHGGRLSPAPWLG